MAIQGYYRFNGNSNDALGTFNGTDTNVTHNVAGAHYSGASFNGSTSRVAVGTVMSGGTNSFTVSAFVKYTSSYVSTIFCHSMTSWGFILHVHPDRYLKIDVVTSNIAAYASMTTTTVPEGKWCHCVGVFNSSSKTIQVFLNGKPSVSTATGTGTLRGTGNCDIGFRNDGNGFTMSGSLDDVIIDKAAWSFAQVKNEYSRLKGFF